jgi:hypothetical protein
VVTVLRTVSLSRLFPISFNILVMMTMVIQNTHVHTIGPQLGS